MGSEHAILDRMNAEGLVLLDWARRVLCSDALRTVDGVRRDEVGAACVRRAALPLVA